jgi:N-methylhydantoinase B/oxoprolinase/acetone carboxylase alpha subunit
MGAVDASLKIKRGPGKAAPRINPGVRLPANAIDLEVIHPATLQVARELTLNMLRTGYLTIIKESQDFTFGIFDRRGRMVAQGVPQPLHIGPRRHR